jgi:hypothetical protein
MSSEPAWMLPMPNVAKSLLVAIVFACCVLTFSTFRFVMGMGWTIVLEVLGIHAKFRMERALYEAAVAEIKAGTPPRCVAARTCIHEPGSQMPLAFPWDGIVDNWIGIVYDPTGTVVDVDRFRGIFGGDLVGCRRVIGPYFVCSFREVNAPCSPFDL